MTPEISEFSYGFALTNELVGWSELAAAPIFPTLVEEGKKTGGYDVKLDYPAVPLYLQFKRADCMMRRSAREIAQHELSLSVPFYRFAITERSRSFQHTSLLTLDDGANMVFYVAPRFHTIAGINKVWDEQNVAGESIFVAPSEIGIIDDDAAHHVSYDETHVYCCSEPKTLQPVSITEIRDKILSRFDDDDRSLRQQLPEWGRRVRAANELAMRRQAEIRVKMAERRSAKSSGRAFPEDSYQAPQEAVHRELHQMTADREEYYLRREPRARIPLREGRELSEDERMLRDVADEARRDFNAMLCVIQKA